MEQLSYSVSELVPGVGTITDHLLQSRQFTIGDRKHVFAALIIATAAL
jgi:catalase